MAAPPAAADRLETDRSRIGELLSAVPAGADIVDVDEDELAAQSPAGELWQLLRGARDGLGPTLTSKLLTAKRPRLLPVWDSFVRDATGMDTRGYWNHFRSVMTADDRRIWQWLCGLAGELAEPSPVSPLRVLDVLLWASVEQAPRANHLPDGER